MNNSGGAESETKRRHSFGFITVITNGLFQVFQTGQESKTPNINESSIENDSKSTKDDTEPELSVGEKLLQTIRDIDSSSVAASAITTSDDNTEKPQIGKFPHRFYLFCTVCIFNYL